MPTRRPDTARLIVCLAMALVGGVWMLQGIGVPIGGSFMVGDARWTAIGAVLVVAAAVLALRAQGRG